MGKKRKIILVNLHISYFPRRARKQWQWRVSRTAMGELCRRGNPAVRRGSNPRRDKKIKRNRMEENTDANNYVVTKKFE